MEQEIHTSEDAPISEPHHDTQSARWIIGVGALVFVACIIGAFVFLQTKKDEGVAPDTSVVAQEDIGSPEGGDRAYGGGFYRKDNRVYIDRSDYTSLKNIELPAADPDTFSYLQGLAGYDKDNFHYLKHDYETGYSPVHVPISPPIKQLFDLVEVPGGDVKIVWTSNTDVVFENITYRLMPEYVNFNAFRIEILELLNNGNVIGYLWVNGLSKTNVANNKLYLYTDSNTTGFKEAVYEVSYGNQPEMILDVSPDKTTFKPGGSKIYYTKSYNSLEFYEYDTITRMERQIPIQYSGTTTDSSRVTLSPDEKFLLVEAGERRAKSTMLVDIQTGAVEVVREKQIVGKGGDFPFAVSPRNDKVFFLKIPYEGYLFASPFYVEKNVTTGLWGDEVTIPSIKMEVGGGWNIDTGQWSISPSGRYLAVANATEDSISSCGGMGDTPTTHNVIKIFDMETFETEVLITKGVGEYLTLNAWASDESGIFATTRTLGMDLAQNCGDPIGEGVQEFYSR